MEESKSPSPPRTNLRVDPNLASPTHGIPTGPSPATSAREFPSSPAAEYLAQKQAEQQQRWVQEQLEQQQQAYLEEMRKMHAQYQASLAEFEAKAKPREMAAKLSAELEYKRAEEAEQCLRRTTAERDTIELTRQRERAASHDAEARAEHASNERERYAAEVLRMKTQIAQDADALRA
ncbi:hypothetical protein LEN26_001716 [Aphanomyces euteiches]|nr:hypothetical protein AeMF1_004182 [Aphanomyces euteiches]KAH9160753.1 hypothetical protein LEN26_001716 [Aphanomyces euteiches]